MSIYTIQTTQLAPHEDLAALVKKHRDQPWQRPISTMQAAVFEDFLSKYQKDKPLILDSGCGTGMSTLNLALEYPGHCVAGLDKSFDRLARARELPNNAFLLRADVRDFWRLFVEAGFKADRHMLFYPNPYPKKSQLAKRWQGHPVFPILMQTAYAFEVRSNWRLYLEEFREAADVFGFSGAIETMNNTAPMTLFEKKYQEVSEVCYVLRLA